MTLRTITVPDPAPGADWVSAVPGKYLYDVTGISATLTTPNTFPPLADASGNGNDAPIRLVASQSQALTYGFPGALAGDAAIRWYQVAPGGAQTSAGPASPSTMTWDADFTIEMWLRIPPGFAGISLYVASTPLGSMGCTVQSTGLMRILRPFPDVYTSATGAVPFDDAYHLYQWVFPFGAAVRFYRDGVQQTTATQTPVGLRAAASTNDTSYNFPASDGTSAFLMDELAIYPAALSAGQVTAHYAARTSFAAYSAAVLADTPAQYYHLDETSPGGGRQVALEVTDGASIVELIPTGFEVSITGNVFGYSWQPRLQARAEAADFSTITVPCPELHLPAGYTVGTLTPDLGPADQWSNILIWWDDALQTATQQADAYQYAPGAHLIYQQVKGGT